MERTFTITEFREYLEDKKNRTIKKQILGVIGSLTGGILTFNFLLDYAATTFNLREGMDLTFKQYCYIIVASLIVWLASSFTVSNTTDNLGAIQRLMIKAFDGEIPEGITSPEDIDMYIEAVSQQLRYERQERSLIYANNMRRGYYY